MDCSRIAAQLVLVTFASLTLGSCRPPRLDEVRAQPGEWSLDPEPLLDLGDRQVSNLSAWVGFEQSTRRSDDSFVIVDEKKRRIRVLGSDGKLLRTIGQRGSAPGEFSSLVWVGVLPGDSIYAYDIDRTEFSKFSPNGDFVRSVSQSLTANLSWIRPVGLLPDRRMLMLGQPVRRDHRVGLYTDSSVLVLLDRHRLQARLIGQIAAFQQYVPNRAPARFIANVPFTPTGQIEVFGDGFVYGWGSEPFITLYSTTGETRARIALPLTPQPVDERADRAARRMYAATVKWQWRRVASRTAGEMPIPHTYPLFDDIATSADHKIWVRPYVRSGERSVSWLVFDSTGVLQRRVRMPSLLTVSHVDSTTVLGRYIDEVGGQRLGLFRLREPER